MRLPIHKIKDRIDGALVIELETALVGVIPTTFLLHFTDVKGYREVEISGDAHNKKDNKFEEISLDFNPNGEKLYFHWTDNVIPQIKNKFKTTF